MAAPTRRMKLAALLHTGGQHVAAWRHPDGVPDAGFNLAHYRHLARIAEGAKFDFVFVADVMGVRDWPIEVIARCTQMTLLFEPLTLMASLSAVTTNLGFVVTASATYSQPYTIARQFASFDLMSGGRVGWNIVTGTQNSEAANFGASGLMDHADRYARAAEFAEVVTGLWRSNRRDVVRLDKAAGEAFAPDGLVPFHHHGEYYRVDGLLNVPPSPQGHPVVVQAGASGPGRALAAQVAEIIFASVPVKAAAIEYYSDIKARMQANGRDADSAVVLPGIVPIIADTRAEAEAQLAELNALIHPDVSIAILSDVLGIDVSALPPDEPLPALLANSNRSKTMTDIIKLVAGQDSLTVREIADWFAAGMTHLRIAGMAEDVADLMQDWFEGGACDGFLVSPLLAPGGLERFAAEVVPILQERGLFRREYEGATLRENLGLPLP